MNDPKRLSILQEALARCRSLKTSYPNEWALESIERQLQYLEELEFGVTLDRTRLSQINVGLLGIRMISDIDEPFAERLSEVSGLARIMEGEGIALTNRKSRRSREQK